MSQKCSESIPSLTIFCIIVSDIIQTDDPNGDALWRRSQRRRELLAEFVADTVLGQANRRASSANLRAPAVACHRASRADSVAGMPGNFGGIGQFIVASVLSVAFRRKTIGDSR